MKYRAMSIGTGHTAAKQKGVKSSGGQLCRVNKAFGLPFFDANLGPSVKFTHQQARYCGDLHQVKQFVRSLLNCTLCTKGKLTWWCCGGTAPISN